MMRCSTISLSLILTFGIGSGALRAQPVQPNWPQFRGPGGRGISSSKHLPERWSDKENIGWKSEIPGRAWSSPIVWGERVFVTTAISSGELEEPKKGLYMGGERPNAERPDFQWKMLCLDLSSGKVLWEHVLAKATPTQPKHVKNSYASETPVTDGERVVAYLGNAGVYCLDLKGHSVWSKPLTAPKTRYGWGTAASPLLHGERLYILNDNDEDSYLMALDKRTGKQIWRVARDEKSNWATPFVWENEKRTEIVTAGSGKVRSYDLDGKLRWSLTGMSHITIATPYAEQGLLYVSSGFVMDKSRPLYAIRPGAEGDISLQPGQTNSPSIAWCQPTAAPYNPTTLVYEGRLSVLHDRGELSAYNARTGAMLYDRQKLPEGLHFTASPWAYGDRIFCLNEDGITFVVQAGDRFELLRTNKLAPDDMCLATPALAGDRLLIRSSARLYCVGSTK
ncbi:MAG: serine/threonine protein kinase [Verrucomicrobia bacterium]|nr:MAG: serine/threonine protein kinase [Verrucomicrobiota bacterium]